MNTHFSGLWIWAALFALACWPGLRLTGRRMRTPPFEELAEADGRRPVLVLHRFAEVDLPFRRRAAIWQRGLRRDWRDSGWLRAIRKGFDPAGPVVPFARPAPPPERGPVAMAADDEGWEAELERRLKTSRLAVIVLDGSEACRREIERSFELLGPRRTVLLMPARPERGLAEAWPALQARVAGLPDFDSHAIGYRFERDGRVLLLETRFGAGVRRKLLSSPSVMLFDHEPTPGPRVPSIARPLMALPALAGLAGAVAVPLLLDLSGFRIREGEAMAFGLVSVVLGITLTVMSRRAFRLVPSNELPFVFVASLPWLVCAGVTWAEGKWTQYLHGLTHWLKLTILGAAYAAPLLLAVSVVLAGSALVRRAPNRSPAHAAFGLAALVPFAPLVWSLRDAGLELGPLALGLAAGAFAVGRAAYGASGVAGRPHAPLPVGAAASAALAIAASGTVVTCERGRALLYAGDSYEADLGEFLGLVASAPELAAYGEAWVWFLLTVPAAVVLVASLHHGRASRLAVGNLAALAPMVVIFGLVSTAQAGAMTAVGRIYVRSDAMLLHRAIGRSGGPRAAELAPFEGGQRAGQPVHAVVTAEGAWAGGREIAGLFASPSLDAGEVRRIGEVAPRHGPLRIAVGTHADVRGIRKIALAARQLGAPGVMLVGARGDAARGVLLPLATRAARAPPGREERVLLFLQVRNGSFRLAATDGSLVELPSQGSYTDYGGLAERLRERRRLEPQRRDLTVEAEDGVEGEVLMRALELAEREGYTDLALGL